MEIKEQRWQSEADRDGKEEGGYVSQSPRGVGCAHQHG